MIYVCMYLEHTYSLVITIEMRAIFSVSSVFLVHKIHKELPQICNMYSLKIVHVQYKHVNTL